MSNGSAPDLPVLILSLPKAETGPGADWLAQISGQARIVTDVGLAEAKLAAGSVARLVVLCPAPEAWVALSLAAGEVPSRAVQTWREALRPLMRLLRARRRQTMLLFHQSLEHDPAGCAAALGLPSPDDSIVPEANLDPILRMIACGALSSDPTALSLAEELAATAISPIGSEIAEDQDLDAMFGSYVAGLRQHSAAMSAQAESAAQLAQQATDMAGLRAALGQAEAALAKQQARAQAVEAETELLRDQIRLEERGLAQAQAALEAAQSACEAARLEAASLRAARVELECALAAARAQAQVAQAETQAKLAALAAEAELLRDQIRLEGGTLEEMQLALMAERDMRASLQATTEAQAKSAVQAERAARAEAQADRDEMIGHLRAQLYQAGQELEICHAHLDGLQSERADLLTQIEELRAARADLEGYYDHAKQASAQVDVLNMHLEGLQDALRKAQAEAAERAQHVAWLQDEISRIHRSRSYRLTTPLRKLRTTIGGTNDSA